MTLRSLLFYRREWRQRDEEADKNGVWVGLLRPLRKKPVVGVYQDGRFFPVAYCIDDAKAEMLQQALTALCDVALPPAEL